MFSVRCGATDGYWIGLTDLVKQGHFVWSHNGETVNKTWWACGQPQDAPVTERCVGISAYHGNGQVWHGWHNYPCNDHYQLYAICEMDN